MHLKSRQPARLLTAFAFGLMSAAAAVAQMPETYDFDIESQPLEQALEEFARTTRRQVMAETSVVSGIRGADVRGRKTAGAALDELVAGTGLAVTRVNGTDFALEPGTGPAARARGPVEVDEILVYGTKQNLGVQDTQTSVALFDQQRVDREVLFSLDDILLRTANVSTQNVQTGFSIRGISKGGVGFAGTGNTANVYVDGAPLSSDSQQGIQSLWDVEQVEVLLGPQSTVQGRNALAGAIVVRTLDPTYDWQVRARAQAATEEVSRGSIAVSGPIVDEQLAFRFAYDNQSYDAGVTEVISGIGQEFQDAEVIRGKLLIEPNALPDLRVELIGERVETDFGEFNTRFAPVAFDDPAFADYDPYGDLTYTRVRLENAETTRAIADLEYDLSPNWSLIGLLTYEENERQTRFGTPVAGEVSLFQSPTVTDTYSIELRAAFSYERLNGWIGAYYFDEEIDTALEFSAPIASLGISTVDPADAVVVFGTTSLQTTENRAVFGELSYALGDSWTVTLGARFDEEEFFNSGNQGTATFEPPACTVSLPTGTLPCTALFPPQREPSIPADFDAFLPRGALTYRFDDDRSLSFSVQRGYRAGGAIVRTVPSEAIVELVPFDPEYVTNYEFAFRSQWLDRRLTANANLFFTEWNDQQVSIPGPSGLGNDTVVENAGSSELYGLELNLNYVFSDSLSAFATLGLLETEFTDFSFAFVPGPFENLRGNEFPAAPNVTAAAGFNYEHDSGFYTSWSASYRGSQESDVTNLAVNAVGSYTLVNARLGYRADRWTIYAFANNLFDERFTTRKEFTRVNTASGAVTTVPNARFQINEPRIAGLAIEVAFEAP